MNIDHLADPAYFTRTSTDHSRLLRLCSVEMYRSDLFMAAADLAGMSALAIPVGKTETGLPIDFQIIGNKF